MLACNTYILKGHHDIFKHFRWMCFGKRLHILDAVDNSFKQLANFGFITFLDSSGFRLPASQMQT